MCYINTYKTKITKEHIDFMGHVNNAMFLILLEEARWHFYNEFGYDKEQAQTELKGPIITDLHIKYRKEIFLQETITIKTECIEYREYLGKLKQIVYKENGKISCYADLVFAYFDIEKRKLIPPSGKWKNLYEKILTNQ